ncbi:MAG: hypothetical protein OXU86_00815 [Thaumarchaeota archaeon]|nr:hypothetical protein [Nitrososphaerota archaeon]
MPDVEYIGETIDPVKYPDADTYEVIEMKGLVDGGYVLDRTDPKNPKIILLRLGGTMIHCLPRGGREPCAIGGSIACCSGRSRSTARR